MDCPQIQFCEGFAVGDTAQPSVETLQQLQTLFQGAAFWAQERRVDDLAIAIANSKPVLTAWDGKQLIGFARATSDGIYRATVWDVVIHPDYRGLGLGRQLMERMLVHPHIRSVERVYLMTTHHKNFYERLGFEVNSSHTMVLYNKSITAELN